MLGWLIALSIMPLMPGEDRPAPPMTGAPAIVDPDARQWACEGSAEGPRGSDFSVIFYTLDNGQVVSQSVTWDPPRVDGKILRRGLQADSPDLTIHYDKARSGDLGKPTLVLTTARGLKRSEETSVTADFEGPTSRTWTVDLERGAGIPEVPVTWRFGHFREWGEIDPTTNEISSLHEQMEISEVVRLTLLDSRQRVLGWTRYRVGERSLRDQLFSKAWAQAGAEAKTPTRCSPMA